MSPNFGKLGIIARDVAAERQRQYLILSEREGFNTEDFFDVADPLVDYGKKAAVLGEEFGEVCRAALQHKPVQELRKELIQTMAVCAAWLESLL